jgi:hypothetical protein
MKMQKRLLPGLFAIMLTSVLTVLGLAGCPAGGGGSPDFVGTWVATTPMALTLILGESTWSAISGTLPDTESLDGTITSYDGSAKHLVALVAHESYTGSTPTQPKNPGDSLYMLYSISGSTMTIAFTVNGGYPPNLIGGIALTKQ